MASLYHLASYGSFDEFMSEYKPADATDPEAGERLLKRAVTNGDIAARVAIATRLLDDGADPAQATEDGANVLHALLGARDHDFAAEAPLLERLIAGGADINKVIARFGTPLETATVDSAFTESELAPVYDVFFAQPDLDLLQTSLAGRAVIDRLRDSFEDRTDLVARAEAYLAARGLSES